VAVRRKGKLAIVDLGGESLVFHLKMTGSLEVLPERRAGRSTALVIRGTDRRGRPFFLHFNDTRKFGFVALVAGDPLASGPAAALGPDALDLTAGMLEAILSSSRRRIKTLLLDQETIAGIGNIYADETLHRARLHPLTRADRVPRGTIPELHAHLGAVLAEAVARGGSSVRDYVDPCGRRGSFQEEHAVYGRAGEPCRTCGRAIVRTVVGGRGTHLCPSCQPAPRRRRAGARGH
jgi:formamidopyrimidine-DNA glycosylase